MKRLRIPILLFLLGLTLAACQAPSDSKKLAIVGAKLIDGKGGPELEHSIVLIEGTTIVKVGTQAAVPLPKEAEVIDGMGQTIEPVPGGGPIEAGKPASLIMKDDTRTRTMKDGQWQK